MIALTFQVFDWNMVMRNVLIAEASILLKDIQVSSKGFSKEIWYELTRTGMFSILACKGRPIFACCRNRAELKSLIKGKGGGGQLSCNPHKWG